MPLSWGKVEPLPGSYPMVTEPCPATLPSVLLKAVVSLFTLGPCCRLHVQKTRHWE